MTITTVAIKPVTLSPSYVQPPQVADYAQVSSATVILGQSASGGVVLGNMSSDEVPVFQPLTGSTTVAMTDAQYAKWGIDDEYAVACFILNMGLEPV